MDTQLLTEKLIDLITYSMEDLGDEDILSYISSHGLTADTRFDEEGLDFDEMCAIEVMTAISQDLQIDVPDDEQLMELLLGGTIADVATYLAEN